MKLPRMFRIFPKKVILWGGTGQAKVVRPIIESYGAKVVAVFDDNREIQSPFSDVPIYYGKKAFERWIQKQKRRDFSFCIAIGNPHGRSRIDLHKWLLKSGLKPATVVHPGAKIAESATIGEGCQFMAGAIVNPLARLGIQCIINTNASVDHECVLGDGVGISPGATLCGQVTVGVNGWICAGATVLPRVRIGSDAIVGAGAVVLSDVPDGLTVVGVPATRILARRKSEK